MSPFYQDPHVNFSLRKTHMPVGFLPGSPKVICRERSCLHIGSCCRRKHNKKFFGSGTDLLYCSSMFRIHFFILCHCLLVSLPSISLLVFLAEPWTLTPGYLATVCSVGLSWPTSTFVLFDLVLPNWPLTLASECCVSFTLHYRDSLFSYCSPNPKVPVIDRSPLYWYYILQSL